MDENLILKKLDTQAGQLANIEKAISKIAVQDEKILNLQAQVSSLWNKYDTAFGPDGTMIEIQKFQASCPRNNIETDLKRQWGAIAVLAAMVTGAVLKAFGAF